MSKPKYVMTATTADGKSVSKTDRALGVVGGIAVYDDKDLNRRLEHLPEGVTVTLRAAND
jgi:hypothetical protein